MVLGTKMGVMVKARKLAFSVCCRTSQQSATATDWALSIKHTGTDATEVGIGADKPTCILHMGMGSENRDEPAYLRDA